MRDHLKSFFDEFEFDSKERVTLSLAYERICECPKAYAKLDALIKGYERDTRFVTEEHAADIENIAALTGTHPYTAILLTVICLYRTTRERLIKIGLSKRVVHDTLFDLKLKMKEGQKLHGVVGTEHFTWYLRFLALRIFAFGRLQFELKKHPGPTYVSGGVTIMEGDDVLSMHIPRNGEPLLEKNVNASVKDAKKVFTTLLGAEDIPIICNSWLLAPKNLEFLPEKSNIAKFIHRFDVIKTQNYRKDRNTAIPFLYEVKSSTPIQDLPENTSLQRAYKAYMLEGGHMAEGFGIFKNEPKEK